MLELYCKATASSSTMSNQVLVTLTHQLHKRPAGLGEGFRELPSPQPQPRPRSLLLL